MKWQRQRVSRLREGVTAAYRPAMLQEEESCWPLAGQPSTAGKAEMADQDQTRSWNDWNLSRQIDTVHNDVDNTCTNEITELDCFKLVHFEY